MILLRLTAALAALIAALAAVLLLAPRTLDLGPAVVDLQQVNSLLVLFVSALVVVVAGYSARNLLGQDRLVRFGALLLTAYAGLLVMVTAGTLVQFAIGWTVSGQATALLVAHAGTPRARRASRYVGSWLLVSDVLIWLAVLASVLDLAGSAAGAVLVLACIVRTGLVPAHRWLAQTAEAPSPVSAFLHAGIINAAGIAVVLWLPLMRPWLPVLLVSACASVIVGLWTIRARTDVKGKLASSTSTQMAFMSIEAAIGLPGLALLHLLGHGSYKSWCFLRAGGAITRGRLGHRPVPRSVPVIALGVVVAIATVAATWALLGELEPLSAVVGAVAAVGLIAHASGGTPRLVATASAIAAVGLGGYLLLVHAWLAWLPVPHWIDAPLLLLALASLAVGALVPSFIQPSTLQRISWYLIAPRWMRTSRADALSFPAPSEPTADSVHHLRERIDIASGVVAPTWPLRTAVAINPLRSLTDRPFPEAASTAATWGASLYPSASHYLQLLEAGEIARTHLDHAAGGTEAADRLIARTRAMAEQPLLVHEDASSPAWEEAHRWCQLAWSDSQAAGDCFTLWHDSLPSDTARAISPVPLLALHQALEVLRGGAAPGGDPDPDLSTLTALIAGAPGWAAHASWRGADALVQLLALRACLAALHAAPLDVAVAPVVDAAEIWQQALEATFDDWLTAHIDQRADSPADPQAGAEIGVVACIDVRSEPMRRALEASSVRTFGAAGFFGVDARLQVNDSTLDLAPVILTPSAPVRMAERPSTLAELAAGVDATMVGVGGLAIAEGYGLACLVASLLNTAAPGLSARLARHKQPDPWLGRTGMDLGELSLDARVQYAGGFLDSLGTRDLPALLAVAGHGADAANNAFAAAYQCGACGGNSGTVNARMVVSMLNDPQVRERLTADGRDVSGTVFIAALHNTTTQELVLDPQATLAEGHRALARDIEAAAAQAHALLTAGASDLPGRDTAARGQDWAQPFPEWGLVGNAACVIGPRGLTAGHDLHGRVFLHEYDWTLDPDGAVLGGILAGPGVVMHMINMQYFCSTADPGAFGARDKTRHNAVGDMGVLVGATGDLHYGLPWQSTGPTPDLPRHVPVRLRLLVAAPPEVLAAAVQGTALQQLADNGWLTVTSVESLDSGETTDHLRLQGVSRTH